MIWYLYQRADSMVACRRCCGLDYASQQLRPRQRPIRAAQQARLMVPGASANLLEPLPPRKRKSECAPGEHTIYTARYERLVAKALAAEERAIASLLKERKKPKRK
jgi:hypothetical protein